MIGEHRCAAPSIAPTAPVALLLGAAGADGGPDEAVVTRPLLQAWSSGIRTHALDRAAALAARGPETRLLCDSATGIDVTRPDACVAWARAQVACGTRFDLVLGLRDDVQSAAAETARALGLPGNAPEAVAAVQNTGARLAMLAAGGFLVERPEQAARGTLLTAVGAVLSGRPQVFLVAAAGPDGWSTAAAPPRAAQAAVAGEAACAVRHLGLGFGVFRVELRVAGHGIVLSDVRLALGDASLENLLTRTVPCLELFNLVYDDALGRSVTAPVRDLTGRAPLHALPARRRTPPSAPLPLLAGDPDDAAAEPHICRGID